MEPALNSNGNKRKAQPGGGRNDGHAWLYAATVHLDIDPHVVFHSDGYKAGGSDITNNFRNKYYFAVPMLQWIDLTVDEKNGATSNVPPYPHMLKWLRD